MLNVFLAPCITKPSCSLTKISKIVSEEGCFCFEIEVLIESKHPMPCVRCAFGNISFLIDKLLSTLTVCICVLDFAFWICTLSFEFYICHFALWKDVWTTWFPHVELISKHSFENIIFMGRICVMHGVILNYLSHYRVSHRSYTHLIIHSCRHNAFPRILHIRHSNQNSV